ncbi:hypothetical protein [Stutzerimonas stutzeri]|uniref:hypothetical protein n=1 Tax=Stutzerimonas stutzeri TaxID=316 RepID=UPI000C9C22BC|nr:hypothetical protein [Stutzerimonas stutzeri]PNG14539.1 hypothetical protein CXK97_09820 [Stutzerimonas stutzeri]
MIELKDLAVRLQELMPKLVNFQHPKTPDMSPQDLPEWDIGLYLNMEAITKNHTKAIAFSLQQIAVETKRDFVVGLTNKLVITEDIIFLHENSGRAEAEALCSIATAV